MLRRLVCALLVLVLIASAYFGFGAGPNILRAAHTPWQWFLVLTELVYATSACAALWLMHRRDQRQHFALLVFAVSVTVTTGLAPVMWGHGRWTTGLLSATVTFLLVGGLIAARQALAARATAAASDQPRSP